MGELWPSPTAFFQTTLGASVQGATFSVETLSRVGPSHWGQSSAPERAISSESASAMSTSPQIDSTRYNASKKVELFDLERRRHDPTAGDVRPPEGPDGVRQVLLRGPSSH